MTSLFLVSYNICGNNILFKIIYYKLKKLKNKFMFILIVFYINN